MAKSFFLGKSHSAAYAKYRFCPPPQILDNILKYTREKISLPLTKAVDVGCGSGQSTLDLSPHFQHVLGTDVSSNQLDEARSAAEGLTNVEFSVAQAEKMPVESSSIQLITASQCFHWFDADSFFSEAKRVLVPNGVLAVYAYKMPFLKVDNDSMDKRLLEHHVKLHWGTLDSYWDSARRLVDDGYSSVHLPFKDTQRIDHLWSVKEGTVADYKGYITTWSSYQKYLKDNGKDAAEELLSTYIKGVLEIVQSQKNEDETPIKIYRQYVLLLGRNAAEAS